MIVFVELKSRLAVTFRAKRSIAIQSMHLQGIKCPVLSPPVQRPIGGRLLVVGSCGWVLVSEGGDPAT